MVKDSLKKKINKFERDGRIRKGSYPLIKTKIDELQKISYAYNKTFKNKINTFEDRLELLDEIFNELKKEKGKISWNKIENIFDGKIKNQKEKIDNLINDEELRYDDNKEIKKIRKNIDKFNKNEIKFFNYEINEKLTIETMLNELKKIEGRFLVNIKTDDGDDITYYLDPKKLYDIIKNINSRIIEEVEMQGSDQDIILYINQYKKITIERKETKEKKEAHEAHEIMKKRTKGRKDGEFFKYYSKLNKIDLSRYGVYTKKIEDDEDYEKIMNEQCLVVALKNGGMDEKKIIQLKLMIINNRVPIIKLKEICEKLNIMIELKQNDTKHINLKIYGNNETEKYKIGLIDEHYFIIEDVNYTSYCVTNYFNVEDIKNFNKIFRIRPDGKIDRGERYINSFEIIKLLLLNKETHLEEISKQQSNITSTIYYNKTIDDYSNLEYNDEQNCRLVNIEEKEDERINIFFDFETYVEEETYKHIAYLCCYVSDDGNKGTFYGEKCGLNMLFDLLKKYKQVKNIRMIAHNCSYDFTFLTDYIYNISTCNDGKNLYRGEASFGNKNECINIEFKDSYKLISKKLEDFSKMFFTKEEQKKIKKEIMPYKFYTKERLNNRFNKINDAVKMMKKDDKNDEDIEQFLNNITEWKIKKNDKYDIIEYSAKYCLIDCEVLKKGYNIFKKWIKKLDINIDNVISSASLADIYFFKNNCFDEVYEYSGIIQNFIQGCVVGGRVMCCGNEKIKNNIDDYDDDDILNDLDAVSLYPSSMVRIKGYLKGKPKILKNEQLNKKFLDTVDGYFIDIKITDIGIERNFPLMNFKNKKGIRIFTNMMDNEIIRVDDIFLNDLIKFHDIKYEIIKGYYFNDGYNNKINTVIKKIFEKRLELKKEGNPAQEIYKLLMNSGYGKTIMKEHTRETKWFNTLEKADAYCMINYNSVISKTTIGSKYKLEVIKPINEHFNRCHIGSHILSMSKRIMNEVICLAEDNNINIYYQDTDSMHIVNKEVNKLSKIFKKKYNKELLGKNLGQFHCDFDMKNHNNIVSTRSIFLGKKIYIDELKGIENETGKTNIDYHIRLKGIPGSCVNYEARKQFDNNVMKLYESLYDGEKITFDLLEGGKKAKFEYKQGQYKMMKDFTRTIQIP